MSVDTPNAAAGQSHIKDTTTKDFRVDVLDESMKQTVLVDFWAPWCNPCKQLAPVLEKLVTAAGGRVKLVKLDIQDHPTIAGQLGIQSIPAVVAFRDGQFIDGFMGVQPEAKVREFIERVAGPGGPSPIDALLAEAGTRADAGDAAGAAELYAAALSQDAENVTAIAALARLHLDLGDLEGTRRFLDMAPEAKAHDAALTAVRVALDLAEQAEKVGDLDGLMQAVAADPKNYQARFDLALALNAQNQREQAADLLLDIVRKDRTWNEDGARKQLVQFFEAWGANDEATIGARRQLSSILFA